MARISYCPTMVTYIGKIEDEIDGLNFFAASSAAEALYLLRSRRMEAAIIGRMAKRVEITDSTKSYRLKDGNTLIYRQKSGISYEQLKQVEIYTYLSKASLSDVKDVFKNVTFFDSLNECLEDDLKTPVLIDWKDYRDDFELLIPMNEMGKVPYFRAPIIYYSDEDLITKELLEKMKAIVNL